MGGLAEYFTEFANTHAQRRLAHRRLRPDGLEEFVFRDQTVWMSHKIVQYIEGFGGQRQGLRPVPQTGLVGSQPERYKQPVGRGHHIVLLGDDSIR
jgi:hypothetical protein